MPSTVQYLLHALAALRTKVVQFQQLPKSEDRIQGSAQLVAHPRQELGLCPVRFFRRIYCEPERLCLSAIRDIQGNTERALRSAVIEPHAALCKGPRNLSVRL